MIKINVILSNINWKKYIKNPNNFINEKISLINKKNKLYKKKVLICTLLLSGTTEIKTLNKKFRNKNVSTDVLSFPFYQKKKLQDKIDKENEIYLGDIIINLAKIKSKNNSIKFKKELNKLWVHGLIHLFGFKHKTERDFHTMSKIEKKFLEFIN